MSIAEPIRRGIVVAVALAATTVLAAGVGVAPARAHAWLSMAGTRPATVRGHAFPSRARVRVVLDSPSGAFTRTIRTARDGSFAVTYATTVSACGGWTVTATTPGHAAVRLHSPHVMCAPAGAA